MRKGVDEARFMISEREIPSSPDCQREYCIPIEKRRAPVARGDLTMDSLKPE